MPLAKRLARTAIPGLFTILLPACSYHAEKTTPFSHSPIEVEATEEYGESAEFTISGKKLVLGRQDMALLHQLAIAKLDADKHYQSFAKELRQGNLWRFNNIFRFGNWLFETRDNMVALVRHPPRTPVMRFIVVTFVYDKGAWVVNAIDNETMRSLEK